MSVPRVAETDTGASGTIETTVSDVVDFIVRVEKAPQATPSGSRALAFLEAAEEVIKVLEAPVKNIGTDAAVEDIVVAELQVADNNMESIVKAAEEVIETED